MATVWNRVELPSSSKSGRWKPVRLEHVGPFEAFAFQTGGGVMATFRVGDRVRGVTTDPFDERYGRKGDIGTVADTSARHCCGDGRCGAGDVHVYYDGGRDAWWMHSQHLEHLDTRHTSGDLAMALQLARLISEESEWENYYGVADWLRLCVERELGND